MNAPDDNPAAQGLRGWWLTPPRSGMRRLISPWEYRHLRAWAGVRLATGAVTVSMGAFIVAEVDNAWALFGAYLLAAGAANLWFAYWELSIARADEALAAST